ncbi:MAG: ATP-binding protein [Ilumatobacteraceae bacterium]
MSDRAVILVVDADPDEGAALASDLRELAGGLADVEVVAGATQALSVAHRVEAAGGVVPMAFVDLDISAEEGGDVVVALHREPSLIATRTVLVTSRASLHDVDKALQLGAVNGMITRPWTRTGLSRLFEANLATYLVEYAPDRVEEFGELLDSADLAAARNRIEQRQGAPAAPGSAAHPLLGDRIDDDELRRKLVELVDRALGHPPRLRLGPGTVFIEEGEDVGGIYLVLDGTVRLSSHTRGGHLVLHERSTGAIVGLLSLASHRRAMLRCQAVTDVRAIPITLDQLARAFAAEPELAGVMTRVLITSLANRLRRSDELQVELDESLAALSEARAQLVASARFTALGEMAAGMAHELNNPTAALLRSVDHLAEDVGAVVDDPLVRDAVQRQLESPTARPAELRALRRDIAAEVGDAALAERLVDCGVTSTEEARALAGADDAELDRLEAATQLGQTIRSIDGATERVRSLVGSLRSYARGEDGRGTMHPDVDVATGLDDALRLVSHRLDAVVVERDYAPVPSVRARPGSLQQVWSNLFINALDAMDDRGRLTVSVDATGNRVRVRVGDDGPGVPPDLTDRIFEPRFTTKDGRVQFGLGLGLSISRQIVEEHGGTIGVVSEPGDTVFTIELPVGGPT